MRNASSNSRKNTDIHERILTTYLRKPLPYTEHNILHTLFPSLGNFPLQKKMKEINIVMKIQIK